MSKSSLAHTYDASDYASVADYSDAKARSIMQRDMQRLSPFQSFLGDAGHVIIRYDAERFPFNALMLDMLFEKQILPSSFDRRQLTLSALHHHLSATDTALDSSGINEISRKFYDRNNAFEKMYLGFVEMLVRTTIKKDCAFQASPTIRFYFPHAEGFNWRLNYHTDIMLGHPPQEINVWCPLTDAFDSNSIRIASLNDSIEILRRYDFDFRNYFKALQTDDDLLEELNRKTTIVEAQAGDALFFDSRCLHVLQNNKTSATRVSMDLRVMPLEEYEALEMTYTGTGRRKMPFTIGQYYSDHIIQASA